jgi:SAM-dependent methyltransferase
MGERSAFYAEVIEALQARGCLDRQMSVLVVAGGPADAEVFTHLGFSNVTITNLSGGAAAVAPFTWERQDAENLTYATEAFDWAVVSAGLHHCRSPHRALLELYRVARCGLLALEARDSALVRTAVRLGVVDEYELTAVADNDFCAGGVADTAIPNYVYRWTEREVEKTIASAAPHARHQFIWFHKLELPLSIFEVVGGRPMLARTMRLLQPAVRFAVRATPQQANLFGFAVLKPRLPRDLQPWVRLRDGDLVPDEREIRRRLIS